MQLLRYLFAVKERRKQSICVESWKAKRDEEGALLTVLGVASPLALVLPMCILHGLPGFLNVSAIVVWRKTQKLVSPEGTPGTYFGSFQTKIAVKYACSKHPRYRGDLDFKSRIKIVGSLLE